MSAPRCLAFCLAVLLAPAARGEPVAEAPPPAAPRYYALDYEARLDPEAGVAHVSVRVGQEHHLLRRVEFHADPSRYRDFHADGTLEADAGDMTWQVPKTGGSLEFAVVLNHRHGSGGFDSRLTPEWSVFRGDDLLPPVRAAAVKGALAHARLRLTGPEGWTFVTAYPASQSDPEWREVDWPQRGFDRPVGWMAAGQLGVRRGSIAGVRVSVAGPMGQGVRHLDLLAFMRWNLPTVKRIFPGFPERLLVVSAGDPMWRGGLSGPHSLFIHADRPLISGNGTSTLLHELIHVAQGYRARRDEDWIVEGMAEYYTLDVMRRSGTISRRRFEIGLEKLSEWAAEAGSLKASRSSGARTARAVLVMHALDLELRRRSNGHYSLDDVAREMSADAKPVSLAQLRRISATLVGGPLDALSDAQLGID